MAERYITKAEFSEMLEAAIFFFLVLAASSLRQVQTYSEICIFCSVIQYIESEKQPVGSEHEVLVESLETVFDEAHFPPTLALPWQTFPPSESFVPHLPRQSNFQNSPPRHINNSLCVSFPQF